MLFFFGGGEKKVSVFCFDTVFEKMRKVHSILVLWEVSDLSATCQYRPLPEHHIFNLSFVLF